MNLNIEALSHATSSKTKKSKIVLRLSENLMNKINQILKINS